MAVRSKALLALSVALMAASGALAYVLEHDAVGDAPALAQATPGDEVTLKGTLQPFAPKASSAREASAWAGISRHLDNFTYALDTDHAGSDVILVTSPHAASPGTAIVTTGSVLLRTPHPDGSARTLIVVFAPGLDSPILFR